MSDRFSLPDTAYTPGAVANIVRAEVMRALRSVGAPEEDAPAYSTTQWVSVRGYLAARFGEGKASTIPAGPFGVSVAEQEGEAARTFPNGLPHSVFSVFCTPAPSAPAEPLTLRPQGHVIPGVPVPFTESERAFLRVLAEYNAQVIPIDGPSLENKAAASRVAPAARALLAEGELR